MFTDSKTTSDRKAAASATNGLDAAKPLEVNENSANGGISSVKLDWPTAHEFLEWHRTGGPWYLSFRDPTKERSQKGSFKTHKIEDIAQAKDYVMREGRTKSTYYLVNQARPGLGDTKAKKEDIVEARFAHADLDPEGEEAPHQAKARYRLKLGPFERRFGLRPSAEIDSGNGVQLLWRLRDPVVRKSEGEDEGLKRVEAINKAIMILLGASDRSTFNIDRVLRLPGTRNLPDAKKLAKGRVVCPVLLDGAGDEAYELGDFEPVLVAAAEIEAQEAAQKRTSRAKGTNGSAEPAQKKTGARRGRDPIPGILAGEVGEGKRYKSGSHQLHAVNCALVRQGLSDGDVVDYIHEKVPTDHELWDHIRRQDGDARKYLSTQVERARRDVEKERAAEEADRNAVVDELNARHAMVLMKGKALVLTDQDPAGRPTFTVSRVADIKPWYDNDVVSVNGRDVSKFDVWKADPRRRQYAGIEFDPAGVPDGVYNLWPGFAVEPDPNGSCALFLQHVRDVIARGNEEHYLFIIGTLAQMVQQTRLKPGVALAFKGKKRTGKSLVGIYVGHLFRDKNYVVVAEPEHLVGKFNAHLLEAVWIQVEEAFWAGDKRAEGALKHMITSETRLVEPKGVDSFKVRDCARIIVTSNENWVVPATQDERRWAVFEVSNQRIGDKPYFNALVHEMNNGGPAALLHHLLNFDLSQVDVWEAPKTEALRDQKMQSLRSAEAFIADALHRGAFGTADFWPTQAEKTGLWSAYVAYARDIRNDRYPLGEACFSKKLKEIIPEIETRRPRADGPGGRPRNWVFPDLNACRAAFSKWLGHAVDWEDDTLL